MNKWYYSIHNLELLAFSDRYCFIPSNADKNLKLEIKAALVKDFMGYKSLREAKNKLIAFDSNNSSDNPYAILLQEILDTAWEMKVELYKKLNSIKLKEETIISLGIISTIMRLENSYESIRFLIYNHLLFESISINRLIFEQLNYCFNLSQLSPEEFENISANQEKKILSPTNINELKKFLPKAEIGKFYSDLSELAHIDIKRIRHYLNLSDKKDEYLVTMKDISQSIASAVFLLNNLEIHAIIFEYFFSTISDIELEFLKVEKGKLILNSERKFKTIYNTYVDRYNKLINEVEIPATLINDKRIQTNDDDEDDLPF